TRLSVSLEPVQHETDSVRIHWTRDDVNQATQMKWHAETHRHAEDALGEVRHAAQHGAAASEHDARRQHAGGAGAFDLRTPEHEQPFGARLDAFGERTLREPMRVASAGARHPD